MDSRAGRTGGEIALGGHVTVGRLAVGIGCGAVGALALLTGLPWIGLVAVCLLLVLTPWAPSLAVRVIVGLLLVLALGAVAVQLPMIRWGVGSLVLLIALLTLTQTAVVWTRPSASVRPRVHLADWISLVGAALTAVTLGLPYVGGSADDVLLELARGRDPVNHVLGVANLISERGAGWTEPLWPSADGSTPIMVDYPLGFHAAVAGALGLAGVDHSRDLVLVYAWSAVLAVGGCAAILGWIAARVAARLGGWGAAESRATLAALGYVAAVLLGGSFVAPFVLGHAPFLVAATAAIASSWLALELLAACRSAAERTSASTSTPRGPWSGSTHSDWTACGPAALGLLGAAVVALVGAYPPLLAGLVPATIACVWHWTPPRLRPAVFAALGLTSCAALWLWRRRVDHLVLSVGENSTPFAISLILVTLTAAAAGVAWGRRLGLAPARGLAAAAGFLLAAVGLGMFGAARGLPAAQSYYGTKLAEAAWLAALPVLVALASGALIAATASPPVWLGRALRAGGMLGLVLIIGALPVGRTDELFVGPGVLSQRLLEARRAHGEVRVIEAARLAGPSAGDASAMVDPPGWFHPVAHEDAPDPQWRREAVTAALWLATLRGLRTQDTDRVASCFAGRGDVGALPCVASWLAAKSGRRITLVAPSGRSAEVVQTWAVARSDRVRVVVLPV